MDCGADDLTCQILTIILDENGPAVSAMARSFLSEHAEKLIALAGFAFGIYRWWRYREHILHKRLEEYLQESDQRLEDGQQYVLEALQRPTPRKIQKLPLFSSAALRRVIVRHNWDGSIMASSVEASAEAQLGAAKEWIDRRLAAAERSTVSLRKQLATVHILKGAISATSSPNQALKEFRAALAVPGHEANLVAKELEALQLRNEGKVDEALQRFDELERKALEVARDRQSWLLVARAKRFQAELVQAKAAVTNAAGALDFPATGAFTRVTPNAPGTAISIRAEHGPYDDWEQLEQADLHYLAAFLARGFTNALPQQLSHAKTAYEDLLARPISPMWRRTSNEMRLRKAAEEGLSRSAIAASTGHFDTRWLFPYLY